MNDIRGVFPKTDCAYRNAALGIANDLLSDDQLPRLIGLRGSWGAGKTTMLKFVEYIVEHRDEFTHDRFPNLSSSKRTKVLFFDAWKYQASDNITLALISKIASTEPSESGAWYQDVLEHFEKCFIERQRDDLSTAEKSRDPGVAARKVFLATLAVVAGVVGCDELEGIIGALSAANELMSLKTLDPCANDAAMEDQEGKDNELSALLSLVNSQLVAEDYAELLFSSLSDVAVNNRNSDRIVVVVDNLDRCTPTALLDLLEKFFNASGLTRVHLIIPLDPDATASAIKSRYFNFGHGEVESYIKKIIPLEYSMPPLPSLENGSVLSASDSSFKAVGESLHRRSIQVETVHKALAHVCSHHLHGNPREAIQLFDRYSKANLWYPDVYSPTGKNSVRFSSSDADDCFRLTIAQLTYLSLAQNPRENIRGIEIVGVNSVRSLISKSMPREQIDACPCVFDIRNMADFVKHVRAHKSNNLAVQDIDDWDAVARTIGCLVHNLSGEGHTEFQARATAVIQYFLNLQEWKVA